MNQRNAPQITKDIGSLIDQIQGQIKTLNQMLRSDDLIKVVSVAETDFRELTAKYTEAKGKTPPVVDDLLQIETALQGVGKLLSFVAGASAPPRDTNKTILQRALDSLDKNKSGLAVAALVLALLGTIYLVFRVINQLGASAWQTMEGGRAVLLLALTIAFVIFGGALVITPLFSEGNNIDERFRRSREIFLMFSGMFATVVGFYFASSNTAFLGSNILIAETFNPTKAEMQVAVAGGKSPYTIEVEYGDKGKKGPIALEDPGTVTFQFSKDSDWPKPMTIKVTDQAKAKGERKVVLDKEELISAGFKEPKKDKKAEQEQAGAPTLVIEPKFDAKTGTVEVIVKDGKPPYRVEAIYGKNNMKKPMTDIDKSGGTTKFSFEKGKDWPSPLVISVKDSEGTTKEQTVPVDEGSLVKEGFKK